MDTEYKCTLSEACLQQAKDELHEDPRERLGTVQALRDWIQQQPHLACRTDTAFLLKFLRTAKFSQLTAREMIEGYLGLKTEFPLWYNNWNPLDPDVAQFFKAGVIMPLPGYYKNGMRVLLFRYDALRKTLEKKITEKYKEAYCRYWFMIILHILKDENVQVSGLLYLVDFTNFPMKAVTMFNISEARDILKYQGRMPGRFKGFWLYNEGTFADAMLTLFRPFMKKKLQDRIRYFGNNLEKIYKELPKSMLPQEYLPDDYVGPNAGSCDTLADNFYKDITNEMNLNELLYESDSKWGINKSAKPIMPVASFRKLNID